MEIPKLLFQKLASLLSTKNIYLTKSLSYRQKPLVLAPNFDYIRFATLNLCAEEIILKNITGDLAEVGVYRGGFAKRLNQLFPDRKLYLFDTFEGFSRKDIEIEKGNNYSKGDQDFSDTSLEGVRSAMPFPKSCIFRKGYFPQTAEGLETTFCLVSLDADLFEPIYQGLHFFYPRLENGGFILVHDFNNDEYPGAREAVIKYTKEARISYVPIPDSGGTVVISK